MSKLKVLAADGVLVPRHELEIAGSNRKEFIGRKFDPAAGPSGGWVSTGEAVDVPTCDEGDQHYPAMFREYRLHVHQGSLVAADEATARVCGIQKWALMTKPLHDDPTVAEKLSLAASAQAEADAAKSAAEAAAVAHAKERFIADATAKAGAAWDSANPAHDTPQ